MKIINIDKKNKSYENELNNLGYKKISNFLIPFYFLYEKLFIIDLPIHSLIIIKEK